MHRVVYAPRDGDGRLRLKRLDAGRMAEHLHVDAAAVHIRKPHGDPRERQVLQRAGGRPARRVARRLVVIVPIDERAQRKCVIQAVMRLKINEHLIPPA